MAKYRAPRPTLKALPRDELDLLLKAKYNLSASTASALAYANLWNFDVRAQDANLGNWAGNSYGFGFYRLPANKWGLGNLGRILFRGVAFSASFFQSSGVVG